VIPLDLRADLLVEDLGAEADASQASLQVLPVERFTRRSLPA
jgi:hypothetical protein